MNSPTANPDMLSFIKNNCKQLLGTKFWQVRFMCKVDAGWGKSEKLESKYLVLSKFRFFFLSGKSTSKLQVDASFNVLSIAEINAAQSHELLLGLDGRKLHLRLNESGYSSMDVATQLLQAFKNYFPSCDLLRFMHLEPSSLYALFTVLPRSRPSLSCDGFRRTYASLCDFYKLPFRDEVVWDIEKIYTLHNASVLRLDDFSHLYPKDLIPVIATLQFMTWFSGISSETFKLANEVVEVIITVVKKSQQLKSLILRNCGLKSDFLLLLASALNANPTIPLDLIDLSGNTFDDNKAVLQFSSALSSLNIGCRSLIFADCGLTTKSMNAICTALQQTQKRINLKTLTSLSFAKNILKSDAGELNHLLNSSALETLDMSGTGVSLESILAAMKPSCDRISILNLSGCTFPERKGKDLAMSNSIKDFFSNVSTLKAIDLSDCALPSEVLKFMLLGVVCNQKNTSLRLDLTRSFADRNCISVLEMCAPNLGTVTELVLRDSNLEQDAVGLIHNLSSMPNLRRLDIGGNNFNGTRKQQPKLLVNIMMEVAKLINDEDGSIRELVLSDCHLAGNLSVLLNALGVAPILISLDISGNDIGNSGARLLAKALQLNTVLQTFSIDKNQISYEGYADILHALKGNRTLRCIPYPLHDACESIKWNREKTESVLAEIEQLLQRNAGRSSLSDIVLNTEAHSRLMLTNVDDEINKAVYSAEHILAECKLNNTNPDVMHVRNLLEDSEKAKKLLDEMVSVLNRNEFIDDFIKRFSAEYMAKFEEKLKLCNTQLTDMPAAKNFSICTDQNFAASLRESSVQRSRALSSALNPMFIEFRETLRQHFKRATFSLACGTVEKVEQEVLRSLMVANKNLDETQNSPSINSTGSLLSTGPSVTSSGTPKSKRKKFRLFARSTRPKSIIESDGVLDNTEETLEEVNLTTTPVDSCGDSLDSESFEVVDKSIINNDEAIDEAPKLMHIVKDRPKLPYQRRHRVVVPTDKRPGNSDLDYAAGVDNFFSNAPNNDERSAPIESPMRNRPPIRSGSPTKERINKDDHIESTPMIEPKRISRLPPNAVPLLTADILVQERERLMAKSPSAMLPRAPPNTPASAFKPRDADSQHSNLSSVSVSTGPIEIDTNSTTTTETSKHMSTISEGSISSHSSERGPMVTSMSPPTSTKIVPPEVDYPPRETEPIPVNIFESTQPKSSALSVENQPIGRSVSPMMKVSPSIPQQPSREATPRQRDDNGNNNLVRSTDSAKSLEENNNPINDNASNAPGKAAMTPPPRPPPPPSAKLRDAKLRQSEQATNNTEPPAEASKPVLRNKPVDAAVAQTQTNQQRKSVMDLTAMFEHTKPPPGAAARPVPPPRPNKSKVTPAN